jgi:hypothetical protein
MPSQRVLPCGAPRVFGNHSGHEGHVYRNCYAALEAVYGPFIAEAVKFEAARAAIARMQLEAATAALVELQRMRRTGRGRRPNLRDVERAARRQGLADNSYASAMNRLEQVIAAVSRKPPTIAELVAQRRAGA